MNFSSPSSLAFPPHVTRASWIGDEDKMWLSEGFDRLDHEARRQALDHCFDCARRGIFDVFRDDPVGGALLRMYMEDNASESPQDP